MASPTESRTPQVLIVGAGAMGLTSGHHLHLAGAEVTFLVRPQRIARLSRPQVLYSYDDASLKRFSEYRLISDATEAADRSYDYVILTIDGAAARSAEGNALLNELGDVVRDTSAIVIVGGIGVRLREHCIGALGLQEERVISGALGLLAHQVAAADLPAHPPTDPALLAQADIAYRLLDGCGFLIENRFPAVAARFKALHDANGGAHCEVADPERFAVQVVTPFPIFVACELMGWPPASRFADHDELWTLAVEATREVVALDEHGETGRAAAARTTGASLARMWADFEESSAPLDPERVQRVPPRRQGVGPGPPTPPGLHLRRTAPRCPDGGLDAARGTARRRPLGKCHDSAVIAEWRGVRRRGARDGKVSAVDATHRGAAVARRSPRIPRRAAVTGLPVRRRSTWMRPSDREKASTCCRR